MLAALVPVNIVITLFICGISRLTFIYLFRSKIFYDRAGNTCVCDRGIVVARWHLVFSFLIIRRLHGAPHDNRGGLPAVPLH